jgi:hypothetical protein
LRYFSKEVQTIKYYAYIGRTCGVYTNWNDVQKLFVQYPFSSVRKFYSEDKAWDYVEKHAPKGKHKIKHIGFTYNELAVDVEYFIYNKEAFVNVYIPDKLDIIITPTIDNCTVTKTRSGVYMIHFTELNLKENSARSHALLFYNILCLLGNFVDVNLWVYDDTLYLLDKFYKGSDVTYLELKKLIKSRLGEVGYTYGKYSGFSTVQDKYDFFGESRRQQEERKSWRESGYDGFEEV